ncbi:glycosyltransferase family 32 protein [Pantoea sp.]|uniref:glycosyltransferase family 32 protein n=1 Tax=Pantoea sp. TaxID=69393 RepID=UPI00289D3284|nr:glycosyltransferase [Pantoea sp.]
MDNKKIPRKIHQVYTGGYDSLSDDVKACMKNLIKINNGWEHHFYDEKAIVAFIARHYSDRYLKAYLQIDKKYGAARADFFRYLVIYKLGGVYLDVKSSCSARLDDVIQQDDEVILCHWDNDADGKHPGVGINAEMKGMPFGEYQQWNIISVPGSQVMKAVIDRVMHNIEHYNAYRLGVGWKGVLKTTGPFVYTNAINEARGKDNIRIVRRSEEIGLVFRATHVSPSHYQHYSHLSYPVADRGWLYSALFMPYCLSHYIKIKLAHARKK